MILLITQTKLNYTTKLVTLLLFENDGPENFNVQYLNDSKIIFHAVKEIIPAVEIVFHLSLSID